MSNDDQDREMRLANFEKQMRLCSKISNFIIEQTRITDRELLELAAKAAGIEHVTPMMVEWGKWNPLDDDGDALRLAAKLFLHIRVHDGFTEAQGDYSPLGEEHNGDPYAATRRAIVRAAAEIGRMIK